MYELTLPAAFTGVPGQANCVSQSLALLINKYGGTSNATTALGYPSATALQNAVMVYCGG